MTEGTIFTDYIQSLQSGGVGEVPELVFDQLRKILRGNLKRRGLLKLPPQLLGYEGNSWKDPETFDGLLYDCFSAVFIGLGRTPGKQLQFLKDQVRAGNSIDGLIFKKIRFFVHDLHRNAFPKDSAVFKNLTKALRQAIIDDDPKLSVVVGKSDKFDSDSIFGNPDGGVTPIAKEVLSEFVRDSAEWAPALMRVSRASNGTAELTRIAIESTVVAGKAPFRFDDLKEVVCRHAYEPAANVDSEVEAVFEDENEKKPVFVRTTTDGDSYETKQQDLHRLVELAHKAIDGMRRRDRIKVKLHQILECYVRRLQADESLKQTDIAQELKVSRSTMSDYMKTIRELLESCKSSVN